MHHSVTPPADCDETPEGREAPRPHAPPTELYERGLRALVVEDNPDTAEALAMVLRSQGISASTVSTGAEALRLVQEEPVQLVLLDIGLPDMKGWRVAHELRQMQGEQAPHIIAVTGCSAPYDRLCSQVSGIDLHLAKPVSLEELVAAVQSWRGAHRELRAG